MLQTLKVLIVDTEMTVHAFVRGAICEICPRPLLTRTGKEAIRLSQIHQPDVVILDLDLPDSEGFDVVSGIRKSTSGQIIVVSNRWGQADKQSAILAGADDYLLKPFFMDELLDRIQGRSKVRSNRPVLA